MTSIEIQAIPRTQGKGSSRNLRNESRTPAIVYSPKQENVLFSIKENDAVKYSRMEYENTIFTLKSEDSSIDGLQVLKKDITFHPVNRRPLHVDFYAVDMTATVRVNVEVKFEGKSNGERDGGVFNVVRREVEVECMPGQIPSEITIDISELKLNESLHVSDLTVPSNVKMITGSELTIATVAEVKEEAATPAAEAPAKEEGSTEGN